MTTATDLSEMIAVVDRIAVMVEGKLMGVLDAATAERQEVCW